MTSEQTVLLKCVEGITDFDDPAKAKNGAIQRLLRDTTVQEDTELGIEGVSPCVRATEDGVVYDLFLNGTSVGYNVIKAFCRVPNLSLPEVVTEGEPGEVYEIPLIGGAWG